MSPFDLALDLQAMTIEKLQFSLPAIFTIGPDNEPKALRKYALLLSGESDGHSGLKLNEGGSKKGHVQDIVRAVIEGETRAIVSTMTMEEVFKERHKFKVKGAYTGLPSQSLAVARLLTIEQLLRMCKASCNSLA